MNIDKPNDTDVFRDEVKEFRESGYFVTYQPADARSDFASVSLVFHGGNPNTAELKRLMVFEMKNWLGRYSVPVMVSSFNASDSLIHLSNEEGGSHLMGYKKSETGEIIHLWGFFQNEEIPATQRTAEYFDRAYRDLPVRLRGNIRKAVEEKNRKLKTGLRVVRGAFIFIAAIPVLIELVSLGVGWLGYILQAISIGTGLYKVGKELGWLKSSDLQEEAEKKRKMEHYYYHCERNPIAFERLKIENFNRETEEQNRKEADLLKQRASLAGFKTGNITT